MNRTRVPPEPGRRDILVLDTITALSPGDAGAVVVSASHGGVSSGRFALRVPLAGVFFNDAGVGKDDAGIRSFDELDAAGVPAATFGCMSARIGIGDDSFQNGMVSHCGRRALELGLSAGMTVSEAANRLARQAGVSIAASPGETSLSRSRLDLVHGTVHLLDSVSMMDELDAGQAVVTGSHGGLISASFVTAHRPSVVSFSDAGVGKDDAGIAALKPLDDAGIASFCVSHNSARIGDPLDMIEAGVVSVANALAARRGVLVGMPVSRAVSLFL
ncbi:MAG: hypothetical protein AB7I79_14010 [Rhizobiaceae bacterium]